MRKILLLTIFAFALCLGFAACGAEKAESAPASIAESEPMLTPSPTPAPTPTPFPEPSLEPVGGVTIDGKDCEDALYTKDSVDYMRLSALVEALGEELEPADGERFSFAWRYDYVTAEAGRSELLYLGVSRPLDAPMLLCDGGHDLFVPLRSFCRALEIGEYRDEELGRMYFTPGAGDWYLPQGYNVPVMMYHGVGRADEDANLMVDPVDFEAQLRYLTENGYSTIWFEDLWHVDDIDRPIILTFDDGWRNNYTDMLPLIEKYHCKATIFLVPGFLDISGSHVNTEQLRALAASEYVSIQSHTVNHEPLGSLSPETQEHELSESKKLITRLVGKAPFVLCYPSGDYTETTRELAREYYRFGVKMTGLIPYNTADDPTLVYRFFPQRGTPLEEYISWLDLSFP